MTSERDPILDLFMNKGSGDFVIVNYAPDVTFGYVASGEMVRIPGNEMKKCTVEILLSNLQGFYSRHSEHSEFERLTAKEQTSFYQMHKLLSITLKESVGGRSLEIVPMRRERG